MLLPVPITKDIVLVGGGHTHALALRMWAMRPVPGVGLTLISPEPTTAYSGMLPGFVAGHYRRELLEIDLVRLARFAGARLVMARATFIDRERRRVRVAGQADIAYDLLSIDIGVTSDMPMLPGFGEHAVPAKPLGPFAERWDAFADRVRRGDARPEVAVIGGGLAGTELALAAAFRLGPGARVALIEAAGPLAAVGAGARRALLRHLGRQGVALIAGQPAVAVTGAAVVLADGRRVPSAFTIGAAEARPQDWPAASGLAVEDGFVRIGPTLQSETDPRIFAAGDIAHMIHAPRPRAGVFAVRQAPVLHHNLRTQASGTGALRSYRPQRDYLKLVSAGDRTAVADKWGLPLDGPALWRWKDRIDRKFMRMFADLPVMDPPAGAPGDDPFGGRPLCGGCGAKVGRPALLRALSRLPPPSRADVLQGAGDDAAVLATGGAARQLLTTDHLRAFWADPWLMARIATVHALGDIWSMGGQAQAALVQVILPPMGEDQQAEILREIMDAAQSVLGPEGADIVGGHTSLGAELTIGLALTGLTSGPALLQSGARPGDRLILTKPIGSGVILAAAMAGRAGGRIVARALAGMARPQGEAARILRPVAHAMTDVTGFGLAGHLLSMIEAAQLSARLDLAAIPLLAGAEALAVAGVGSSLLPANHAARARMFLSEGPRAELLFDPQTAGGLLAAVPADAALPLLDRLLAAGENAALIGGLEPGEPFIAVDG
ncbi:MAG: selenide, water dikinase SelD [Proteobacteria bacterium]|nr:selenide, water dikinase SelD [Pseudomonadota bacterium]